MQFYIFMVCAFTGILSGVAYDFLYVIRCALCGVNKSAYTVKDKIFLFICDFLYCLVFAAGFVFISVLFDFGNFRLFMLIGGALGALIYLKSFHIIVAFFVRKVYNIVISKKERQT